MILNADARAIPLAESSVDCVVTSPPYFGLREYGVEGQIGLEADPDAYVGSLVDVFREVRRVLRATGTVWLNLGDSYSHGGNGSRDPKKRPKQSRNAQGFRSRHAKAGTGLKPKNLIGIPWRVALALQADGWWLRSEVTWCKTAPMPESVKDRPVAATEKVFLLTKSARYFYDAAAVKMPPMPSSVARWEQDVENQIGSLRANGGRKTNGTMKAVGGPRSSGQTGGAYNPPGQAPHSNARPDKQRGHGRRHAGFNDRWDAMPRAEQQAFGANLRNWWPLGPDPFSGDHFAVMPRKVAEMCIKAGCPDGGLVLDPFLGSGTTGIVARRLGRRYVGLELNPEYAALARSRVSREAPPNLFDVSVDPKSEDVS